MASALESTQTAEPAAISVVKTTAPSGKDPVLKRDLRFNIGDGVAYGAMVGGGETYLQAFVLAVGMGDVFAGLVASLPVLIGSLLQLISPPGIRLLKSHKRWVVLCAGLQALLFPATDRRIGPRRNDQDGRPDRCLDLLGRQPGSEPGVEHLAGDNYPAGDSSQVLRQTLKALPDRDTCRISWWRIRTAVRQIIG